MSTDTAATGFRIKGWHVLAMVCGFFAVVVVVDAIFVVSAYRTFPGQVSATPYEDGVAYNRKLSQLAAQAKLEWQVAAQADAGAVRVIVEDRSGAPVSSLAVAGRLERPATEAGRITPEFREVSPGVYEARPGPLSGAWDLSVEMTDQMGRAFVAERRLLWR